MVQGKFGGESAKLKDRIDGLKYGGMWLLVQRDAVPSDGHAIDHIGFRTKDLAASTTAFKAQNVKYIAEPRDLKLPSGVLLKIAFIETPVGAKIELVQR